MTQLRDFLAVQADKERQAPSLQQHHDAAALQKTNQLSVLIGVVGVLVAAAALVAPWLHTWATGKP